MTYPGAETVSPRTAFCPQPGDTGKNAGKLPVTRATRTASNRSSFDARVPVEVIDVPNPAIEGLPQDAYEVIGEKVTHRLAQRPGSYVILKDMRPLIKRKCNASRGIGIFPAWL